MKLRILVIGFLAMGAWAQVPTWSTGAITYNPSGSTISTNGWLGLNYDPVGKCSMLYAGNNSSIYSNSLWCFHAGTRVADYIWTSGTTTETCLVAGTATNPRDRHPVGSMWIDTKRNRLYLAGGVCSGGGGPGDIRDMYYMPLNSNTLANSWNQVTLGATLTFEVPRWAGQAYDPDDDIAIAVGYDGGAGSHRLFVYCEAFDNPTPGTVTAKQSAAGCTTAQRWIEITNSTGGGPTSINDLSWPTLVWDSCNHVMLLFTKGTTRAFGYTPSTRVWTSRSTTNQGPLSNTVGGMDPGPAAFVTPYCKAYYHPGVSSGTPHDYTYDYATDTWADLGATGGENDPEAMTYDAARHALGTYRVSTGTRLDVGDLPALFAPPSTITVTVQEALYPGSTSGVARTNEPLTVGVPLVAGTMPCQSSTPSSCAGIAAVGLAAGPSIGQFRCLGVWPDQSCKWLLVDTQIPSLSAGGSTTITLVSGSGNFGGSNLATDGSTIVVSTNGGTCGAGSAICFDIKKASHNGIDQVRIGSTTVVSTGASTGLYLAGPDPAGVYPANVTCSPTSGGSACTNAYTSANDSSSTCAIEENGPAKAVLKCTGALKSGGGVAYMKFTVRYHFYAGKSYVRTVVTLQNAELGNSGTFASAYKGHRGFELRTTLNLTGTLNFSFANHTATPTTGTMSGSDEAHIYQGTSTSLKPSNWCGGSGCVTFTTDTGYAISKNGTGLQTGTTAQYPQGWADISDGSGVGLQIGNYQMAGYESESLEFVSGGTEARIGFWASQNSIPYYQAWPQWSIHEAYLNFHTSAPSSLPNAFLALQHPLLGRADYTLYNSAGVFPLQMISSSAEDAYYQAAQATANPATITSGAACCLQDLGTTQVNGAQLNAWRWWAWATGGAGTQQEFRASQLMNWIARGMPGRYLDAAHFYRLQAEKGWPHSDGFNWRDQPHFGAAGEKVDGFGRPEATSANSSLAGRDWFDQEHGHWWGHIDYYFMSGDETVRDALEDLKDWHLNNDTYQGGTSSAGFTNTGLWNTRAVGVNLMNSARFARYLTAIGDTDAPNILTQATTSFNLQMKPSLCVSSYPSGCTDTINSPWTTQGVSRERGLRWGLSGDTSGSWCNVSHQYRLAPPFQHGIGILGVLEFRDVKGTAWSDYTLAGDLAYGMGRWALEEMFVDSGNGQWNTNGFRYYQAIDRANSCSGGGESAEAEFAIQSQQTVWMNFLPLVLFDGSTAWSGKFKINLQKLMKDFGMTTSDFGTMLISHLIGTINSPPGASLQALSISNFVDNGGGSYTLSWTVPTGARSYRVKYHTTKTIVDWIGYDPVNGAFIGNPATTANWFASTEASGIPLPAQAGTTQSMTIATGQTGLSSANFSVKAMVGTAVSRPAALTGKIATTGKAAIR